MPTPETVDPTLTPDTFTPADAFDTTDPVNLDELGGEGRAWRAVLDLLARTGEALHIPDEYLPDLMMLNVAAGWHFMPTLRDAQGTHVLTCKYTGWDPRDVKGNFQPGSPFYERTQGGMPAARRESEAQHQQRLDRWRGTPSPETAARARAEAEKLPTVGHWPDPDARPSY